jgi:protein-disulfide isomerase
MHGLRGILIAFALLALGPSASAAPLPDDMALGKATAPVTVIEYASVGCPHCALWANTVFPAFKARWIDSGQVRFVFREMLTGQTALAAAGFLAARCAGAAHYFDVVDGIFRVQSAILSDGDAKSRITAIAGKAGVPPERLDACLENHAALAALEAR